MLSAKRIIIVACGTSFVSGRCPGGNNVKCCVAGGRPSWYINQNEHTQTACYIGGVPKSVATSGCGIASLTMGISVVTGNNLNPTQLFKEAYQSGYYSGELQFSDLFGYGERGFGGAEK